MAPGRSGRAGLTDGSVLYHFSEEPDIKLFSPRAPLEHPDYEPQVWAIDEWHAAMYFVPRDCPRACYWPGPHTTAEDREFWFGSTDARMIIAVEAGWLDRIRRTTLYRYAMPHEPFTAQDDDSGHWTTTQTVEPLGVEPMDDLLKALAASGAELRIMPTLGLLWHRVVRSTLSFSGTRLRNARGYIAPQTPL